MKRSITYKKLAEHLTNNFLPSLPHMYDVALEAIDAVNSNRPGTMIKTTSGLMMTASSIISDLDLDAFVQQED